MATLEKIRSKSVLLVSIIFVALFLFIITIIDNPLNLFSDNTTAVKVAGEKVSIEQVNTLAEQLRISDQPRVQQLNAQRRASGLPDVPAEDYSFIALSQLVDNTLKQKEYDRLGIVVTDDEISSLLVGENASAAVERAFYNQIGISPVEALNRINDPASYGMDQQVTDMLTQQFKDFESEIERQLLDFKFGSMIEGGINANKLDIKALNDEAATNYTLATAGKYVNAFNTTVSDNDIDKYYTEHRETYKIGEPMRHVRYISTTIAPSVADRARVVATVQDDLLKVNGNPDAMEEVAMNGIYEFNRETVTEDQLANLRTLGLRQFLENAQDGDATVLDRRAAYASSDPNQTISQLVKKENKVYSATLNQVTLDGTVMADSILAKLNAGVDPEGLEGVADVTLTDEISFGMFGDAWLLDSLQSAGPGKYILAANPQSRQQIAVGIASYGEPVNVYEYYTAKYPITASRETIDSVRTMVNDFLTAAPSASLFNDEVAAEHHLLIHNALVGQSSSVLEEGATHTGELVTWALQAEPGKVSKLHFDDSGEILSAAAVVQEFKDYIPANFPDLRENLAGAARYEKATDSIISSVKGKANSIADYAKLFGSVRVDTLYNVNLSDSRFADLSGIRGHKPGDLVGPMRYAGSVVVASVLAADESPVKADEQELAGRFINSSLGSIFSNNLRGLLLGNDKVEFMFHRFRSTGEGK